MVEISPGEGFPHENVTRPPLVSQLWLHGWLTRRLSSPLRLLIGAGDIFVVRQVCNKVSWIIVSYLTKAEMVRADLQQGCTHLLLNEAMNYQATFIP